MLLKDSKCSSQATKGLESTQNQPIHHPEYYFDDGNLVVLIEDVLFNIFRTTLTRHSVVFRDIFSLPLESDSAEGEAEGSSDCRPFHLRGISSTDFERLLWVLYPSKIGEHRADSAEEWTSILHLATRWEFEDVRALAIRRLEQYPLTAVNKILLSKEYDINDRWALKAYTHLCERQEPLSLAEATTLGLETTVKVSHIREQLHSAPRESYFSPNQSSSSGQRKNKGGVGLSPAIRIDWRRMSTLSRLDGNALVQVRPKSTWRASRLSPTTCLVADAFGIPSGH